MTTARHLVLLGISFLCACSAGAHVVAGYGQFSVGGDIGLTTGTGTVAPQDVESAFGLGDDNASLYLRAQGTLGPMTVTASGFRFSEEGSGTTVGTFGGIAGSATVDSDLNFANARASLGYDIGLGPLRLSPGLALDLLDVKFEAREPITLAAESFDELLILPMLDLAAELELGGFLLGAEVGYLDLPEMDGTKVELLDAEAALRWDFDDNVSLFVGYRYLDLSGSGESDGDSLDMAMQVSGWMIGGAIRF